MAKLKFKDDDEGNPTKEALGMYSKEGEYVEFDKTCDCSGQVKYIHWSYKQHIFSIPFLLSNALYSITIICLKCIEFFC